MKRIVLIVCGMFFLVANTAEARWTNPAPQKTTPQPARVAPANYRVAPAPQSARPAQPAPVARASYSTTSAQPARVAPVSYSASPTPAVSAAAMSFSTHTAQGVANIMASSGRVGHWGGNTGYEGCGMGPSPQAAFNACCYSNSGMTTVDVGYAQGRNGMWYCCRRYR